MDTTRCGSVPEPAGTAARRPLVRDNPAARRFEIYVGQHPAGYLRYCIKDDEIWLLETVVSRRYCVDNLVPYLVCWALDDARQRRLDVRVVSPAVRTFIAIHDVLERDGR
ncbi:GNAT family N-acetyltransferase [Arthrobacter mobilis]|uniref:N-acetyltransferase n=1 Tax=Arthrobacter mobilis TaxID=2724944 RepID=A0A7X6HGW6_9MICC|nr:N-acetyltransferase [Arthrobacter mobilis]NKX55412.1 N-acetyltransferase [Arthrobacter mobilis]